VPALVAGGDVFGALDQFGCSVEIALRLLDARQQRR